MVLTTFKQKPLQSNEAFVYITCSNFVKNCATAHINITTLAAYRNRLVSNSNGMTTLVSLYHSVAATLLKCVLLCNSPKHVWVNYNFSSIERHLFCF